MNPHSNSDEIKEGTIDDFRYLEGIEHRDDVNVLVYETTRVIDENYPRRSTLVVAYRRLIYATGTCGLEDTKAVHVHDIEVINTSDKCASEKPSKQRRLSGKNFVSPDAFEDAEASVGGGEAATIGGDCSSKESPCVMNIL